MSNLKQLEEHTSDFFRRHWPSEMTMQTVPAWTIWREFPYGPVPNHDVSGCYALLREGKVMYIGLGRGRDHGISRRLSSHVIRSDKEQTSKAYKLREAFQDISAIYTLGFPRDFSYLSASLEIFLIRELDCPPMNSRV